MITPEKMAECLVNEMMEDFDRLADMLLVMEDRWCKYGTQYQHLLTPEKRAELEACMKRFHDRTRHMGDEDG